MSAGIEDPGASEGKGHLGLLGVAGLRDNARRILAFRCGGRLWSLPRREASKELTGHGHHPVMIDGTCGGEKGAAGMVVGGKISLEILPGDFGKALLGSRDRSGQRASVPGLGGEEFLDMLRRFVTDHLDFLDDDAPLPLDLTGVETGVPIHVGQDVRDPLQMFGGGGRVVTGPLLGGVGVQIAADSLDLLADPAGGPLLRPLEQEMLQEMGDAVDPCGFMACSHGAPDSDGGCLG